MKLTKYIYEIYATNEANETDGQNDPLLTGLPMFLSDLDKGKKNYCPEDLDFATMKKEWDAMTEDEQHEERKRTRLFMAHNSSELWRAYPDKAAMQKVVERIESEAEAEGAEANV